MQDVKAADGTRIYAQDWGHGPAIVLVHGWPLDADMWEYQAVPLAEAGFRVMETMEVGGRSFVALRLAHEHKGIEGNTYHSIITTWRDVATGVALRTVEQQIAGQSYGPNTTWTAVQVHPLGP